MALNVLSPIWRLFGLLWQQAIFIHINIADALRCKRFNIMDEHFVTLCVCVGVGGVVSLLGSSAGELQR